ASCGCRVYSVLLRRVFLGASSLWAAAIPLAAFAASRPSVAPAASWFVLSVYAVGHFVCHQLQARSFHLWGTALPVCARCTGIYAGAAMTSIVLSLSRGLAAEARSAKAEGQARQVLLLSFLPTAVTLAFEWSTGSMPANWIRSLAGVPLGAAVAWAI